MTPQQYLPVYRYFFPNEKLILSLSPSFIFLIDNAQNKNDIHIFNSAV